MTATDQSAIVRHPARIALSLTFLAATSLAVDPPLFQPGMQWAITGPSSERRWLEIRDVEQTPTAIVIHISILARKRGAAVWDVHHLIAHMAITEQALQRSVMKPLPHERQSYPESYDQSHQQWLATLRRDGSAPI